MSHFKMKAVTSAYFFFSTRKNISVLHLISPLVVSTNYLVGENNDKCH